MRLDVDNVLNQLCNREQNAKEPQLEARLIAEFLPCRWHLILDSLVARPLFSMRPAFAIWRHARGLCKMPSMQPPPIRRRHRSFEVVFGVFFSEN